MSFQTTRGEPEVMSEINMTPLVDVMLVLLIIFIVTLPVIQHSVAVKLPQEQTEQHQSSPHDVWVVIHEAGELLWQGEPVTLDSLEQRMAKISGSTPPPRIVIQGDAAARYDAVAAVMGAAHRAGLSDLAFATQPGGEP